jgi:hypothetical protein
MKQKRKKINPNVSPLFQEQFPEIRKLRLQNIKRIMQFPIISKWKITPPPPPKKKSPNLTKQ